MPLVQYMQFLAQCKVIGVTPKQWCITHYFSVGNAECYLSVKATCYFTFALLCKMTWNASSHIYQWTIWTVLHSDAVFHPNQDTYSVTYNAKLKTSQRHLLLAWSLVTFVLACVLCRCLQRVDAVSVVWCTQFALYHLTLVLIGNKNVISPILKGCRVCRCFPSPCTPAEIRWL